MEKKPRGRPSIPVRKLVKLTLEDARLLSELAAHHSLKENQIVRDALREKAARDLPPP